MASITGKIQEFKSDGKERFSTYIDRLNLYFDANSVAQDKKVAVFLTVIGAGNYALLSDHFAPDKPKDKLLDELIGVLKGHFEPEPILIAERFQFHKRDQRRGDMIATFVAELRCLATRCFGADLLDQALRDRFVCGLANEAIQKKLLLEADLDLAKAVKITLSLEGADKSSRDMHGALVPALITLRPIEIKMPYTRCTRKQRNPAIAVDARATLQLNVASRRQLATPVVRWAILPQLV